MLCSGCWRISGIWVSSWGGGRGAVAAAVVVVLVGAAVASAAGRGEESFGPLAQRERPGPLKQFNFTSFLNYACISLYLDSSSPGVCRNAHLYNINQYIDVANSFGHSQRAAKLHL